MLTQTTLDASEQRPDVAAQASEIAVAIVGRPNAGKSSLVNRLLREERMIVSEVPGTTRDAVDSMSEMASAAVSHRRYRRDPSARSRGAKSGQVEEVSVLLARRAIERADVVILVIDSPAGATDQDAAIAGAADKAGRGVIIAANKWDLMKSQGPDAYKAFDDQVRQQLKFLDYAPDRAPLGQERRAHAETARDWSTRSRRPVAFAFRRQHSIASSMRSPRSILR